ncbi:serine/threonine-protein kinase [Planomonospora sp. ID82291]|uniref:serine/threonine-protein kinase n=1 Tax=Planomonospora sp. ID82291 TaxID=2738136 RepID=UPI0027DE269D|nr:serine/threonine-protein kinase [Planomonospora sp. ID82291]
MNQPGAEPLHTGDPARIGPYRLLGRLGEGGMGTVYLAQAPTGRAVAVKVVKAEFAIEEGFAARFHAEVENARRVASFCTAQVLDNGNADDGRPYMVTEYIAGTPLSRQIFQYGALEPGPLHGVALGVAAALAAIHVAGLVHRDLKPANVILSLSGPRVIDFGIARALDSTSGFTKSGEVLGSPGWWAPEQVRGQEITPAADVFAWGCLVAYAGNGRHPYGRGNMITMASRLLNGPPDLGALPAPLNDLARVATSMDPAQRPTAQDLLIALVGGGGIALPTPAAPAAGPSTASPTASPTGPAASPGASSAAPGAPAAAAPADPPTLIAADALAESWQAPPNVESDATLTLDVLDLRIPADLPPLGSATPPGASAAPPARTASAAPGGPRTPTGPAAAPSPAPGPVPAASSPSPGPAAASGAVFSPASPAVPAPSAVPVGPVIPAEPSGRSGRTPRWRWVLAGLALVAALALTGAVLANAIGGGPSPATPSASAAGSDVGRRIALGAAFGDPQLIVPIAPSCNLTSYRGATPVRGRFCVIRWTLLNTGGTEVRVSRAPLVLVDDRGSTHTPAPVSSGPPAVLAPGGRADGVLVYDLPPPRKPFKLTGPGIEGGKNIEVRVS